MFTRQTTSYCGFMFFDHKNGHFFTFDAGWFCRLLYYIIDKDVRISMKRIA